MNEGFAELMKWLEEERKGFVDTAMTLIREDAPKNKFSVVTGKLLMIEDVETKVREITKTP